MIFHHVSVLRKETIDNLITDPDGIYVDCTLGGGGHSRALAERLSPKATLIGLDQDRDAIAAATERLKDTACRRILVQRNFRYLPDVLDELGIEKVDGVMFDLGVSSYQLDTPERGFSYMQDGPLDMRMDRDQKRSAYDIVNGGKSPWNGQKNWSRSSRRPSRPVPARTDPIRPSGRSRPSVSKSMMNWESFTIPWNRLPSA